MNSYSTLLHRPQLEKIKFVFRGLGIKKSADQTAWISIISKLSTREFTKVSSQAL